MRDRRQQLRVHACERRWRSCLPRASAGWCGRLQRLFTAVGLREQAFVRLDDCRTFSRFRGLNELELRVRTACRWLRLPYPEHCIVGIYRRP